METKKLLILKRSLANKEAHFNTKIQEHFDTVKQANGQPLNDKRNGHATLNKWEKQNSALRNLDQSIQKTKDAIEFEESRSLNAEAARDGLPEQITALLVSGELIQWRKYPNTFFVKDVDKARIVWDTKKKVVAHKFTNTITDQVQRSKFAKTYNDLYASINL